MPRVLEFLGLRPRRGRHNSKQPSPSPPTAQPQQTQVPSTLDTTSFSAQGLVPKSEAHSYTAPQSPPLSTAPTLPANVVPALYPTPELQSVTAPPPPATHPPDQFNSDNLREEANCPKHGNLGLSKDLGQSEPHINNSRGSSDLLRSAVLYLCQDNDGTRRNPVEAKTLMERASREHNHAPAMFALAILLLKGDTDVAKDIDEADKWFRKACECWQKDENVDPCLLPNVEKAAGFPTNIPVEDVLRAENTLVRSRQCFLLIMNDRACNTSCIIKNFLGFSSNPQSDPSQRVNRVVHVPGMPKLDHRAVKELVTDSETFFGNMTCVKFESTASRALAHAPEAPHGQPPSKAAAENCREVLSTSPLAFRAKASPSNNDCSLVQCWDVCDPIAMSHILFARKAPILLFFVNLDNVIDEQRRKSETLRLFEWLERAYAVSADPDRVKPIIVGAITPNRGEVSTAWRFVNEGFRKLLAPAVYTSWVQVQSSNEQRIEQVTIQHKIVAARSDAELEKLRFSIKKEAEKIISERDSAPARWFALMEELEKTQDVLFLKGTDVQTIARRLPGFEEDESRRKEDVQRALDHFSRIGRVILEEQENDCFVFIKPSLITDAVQKVVTPEDNITSRLPQDQARMLETDGLVSASGLMELWHGKSQVECEVLCKLLSNVDILVPVPKHPRSTEEMFAVLASRALKYRATVPPGRKKGYKELIMMTKFKKVLPANVMGMVVRHLGEQLRQAGGSEKTAVEFVGSAILSLSIMGGNNIEGLVIVEFDRAQQRIWWTVLSRYPVPVIERFLRIFDNMPESLHRRLSTERQDILTMNCKVCKSEKSVRFELATDWTKDLASMSNLHSRCDNCRVSWSYSELGEQVLQDDEQVLRGPWAPTGRVFISHAGTEKDSVARPLYTALRGGELTPVLDDEDLGPHVEDVKGQLSSLMQGCNVAIFVLSPRFVARQWPMWELREFKKRYDEARREGRKSVLLFPLFYKLKCEDCGNLDRVIEKNREVFEEEQFFTRERQDECSTEEVKEILRWLKTFAGTRNDQNEEVNTYVYRSVMRLQGKVFTYKAGRRWAGS